MNIKVSLVCAIVAIGNLLNAIHIQHLQEDIKELRTELQVVTASERKP